jgi:hypothetical protein
LVDESIELAEKLNLRYRVTCIRLPGYKESLMKKKVKNIEEYIHLIYNERTAADPLIRLFMKKGFKIYKIAQNSMQYDTDSDGYGLLMLLELPVRDDKSVVTHEH